MAPDKEGLISQEQYDFDFGERKRKKVALDYALDIRKFEIDLYWKRATYFWTFIGVTFAGYSTVQASSSLSSMSKADLSVLLSCLGFVFSCGWVCANKGSKQWQENWENHVDLLEDDIVGPLYKTVIGRPDPVKVDDRVERWITGPAPFSVSKINQIISLFVTLLWIVLLFKALATAPVTWDHVLMVGAALAACLLFLRLGRTSSGLHRHLVAHKRDSDIGPQSSSQPTVRAEDN